METKTSQEYFRDDFYTTETCYLFGVGLHTDELDPEVKVCLDFLHSKEICLIVQDCAKGKSYHLWSVMHPEPDKIMRIMISKSMQFILKCGDDCDEPFLETDQKLLQYVPECVPGFVDARYDTKALIEEHLKGKKRIEKGEKNETPWIDLITYTQQETGELDSLSQLGSVALDLQKQIPVSTDKSVIGMTELHGDLKRLWFRTDLTGLNLISTYKIEQLVIDHEKVDYFITK